MKALAVLLLVVLSFLCASVHGNQTKRILLVGPDGPSFIRRYFPADLNEIIPYKEYNCVVSNEEVILINAPEFNKTDNLEDHLTTIEHVLPLHLVVFLWSANCSLSNLATYSPVALALLPYKQHDPNLFSLLVQGNKGEKMSGDYESLMSMIGLSTVAHGGDNWQLEFEAQVQALNVGVKVHINEKTEGVGCIASLNWVETRGGRKLFGLLEVGDEVLTPRGYMPVIYVKNHDGKFPCVNYAGVWLTPDHFVYELGAQIQAGGVANQSVVQDLGVRTVVVKGDSFFCNNILVSSYSRYWWLSWLSPLIDELPSKMIDLSSRFFSKYVQAHL